VSILGLKLSEIGEFFFSMVAELMNGECMRGQGASGSGLSPAPLTQARYFSHVEIFRHLQCLIFFQFLFD
jgi:hypothetical protein